MALPDTPPVAVLVFENLSLDADQDELSDGIADDIIGALGISCWASGRHDMAITRADTALLEHMPM